MVDRHFRRPTSNPRRRSPCLSDTCLCIPRNQILIALNSATQHRLAATDPEHVGRALPCPPDGPPFTQVPQGRNMLRICRQMDPSTLREGGAYGVGVTRPDKPTTTCTPPTAGHRTKVHARTTGPGLPSNDPRILDSLSCALTDYSYQPHASRMPARTASSTMPSWHHIRHGQPVS